MDGESCNEGHAGGLEGGRHGGGAGGMGGGGDGGQPGGDGGGRGGIFGGWLAMARVGVERAERVEMADAAARWGWVGMWEGRLVAEMAAAAAAHMRH